MKKIVLIGLLVTSMFGGEIESLTQGCDGGDAAKCFKLAGAYALGKGVKKNQTKAATFYKQACDGGEMGGCRVLGAMYEWGRGVAQDSTKAFTLFKQACDGGDALGCEIIKSRE